VEPFAFFKSFLLRKRSEMVDLPTFNASANFSSVRAEFYPTI